MHAPVGSPTPASAAVSASGPATAVAHPVLLAPVNVAEESIPW